MPKNRKSDRQKSRKPQSSRARNRRLAQRSSKINLHGFDALEDRRLLATLTVGSSLDLVDGDISSIAALISSPGADGISLREAITASNNTAGADTITFDSMVFTGGTDSLIRLTNGELEITDTLTIDGSSGIDVTITGDANGDDITDAANITDVSASFGGTLGAEDDLLDDNSRVLNFTGSTGDLSLVRLTVTGGRTTGDNQFPEFGSESTYNGGGVRFLSEGQLVVRDSSISGNSTAGLVASGGGIFSNVGAVFVDNSSISGNSTSTIFAVGGGIAVGDVTSSSGSLTLTNSIVSGNSTAGSVARGGAIFSSGSVVLTTSNVVGNSTSGGEADGGGVSAGSVTLTNSTVSDNSTLGDNASGGGVHSYGTLTSTDSKIMGNYTLGYGALGGGVSAGRVELLDSNVSENSTAGRFAAGGGVSAGTVTLTNSTVSNNSTAGRAAQGGGIWGREVYIVGSSIHGNSTSGSSADGGGIFQMYENLVLSNSTVSGNFTLGYNADGGGVSVSEASGAFVTNSTISGNTSAGTGGGISAGYVFSVLTINNSIVAGNLHNETVSSSGTPNDIEFNAFYTDLSPRLAVNSSLIGVADNIAESIQGNVGNQLGTATNPFDPMLGPLAFNGGPTRTHALLPGSAAIDAGINASATGVLGDPLANDQRGDGFDRIVSGTVDIGAFEFNANRLPVSPAILSTARDGGEVLERPDLLTTYSVTFDTDVNVEASDLSIVSELLTAENSDLSAVVFSYDRTTQTAIWDFSALTLDAAFYSFQLSDDIVSAIGNVSLDGDGDGNVGSSFVESIYVAIPGDANLDGRVDILGDGFALVANLGTTSGATWEQGDFNGDGAVDVLGDAFILVEQLARSVFPPDTLIVGNSSDIVDGDTSSTVALTDSPGADGISLREAIIASNNTLGAESITFDPTVFDGGSDSLIRLTNGELQVTDSLIIDASTAVDVTITGDANGDDVTDAANITDVAASFGGTAGAVDDLLDDNSRVLNFSAPYGELTLSSLTITGGRIGNGESFGQPINHGGGIRFLSGRLNLNDSVISGNSTTGRDSAGGGVATASGSISLTGSVVHGNSTDGSNARGGGIFADSGAITLVESTVSENSTSGDQSPGGGISFGTHAFIINPGNSFLTLTNSTVSGNSTSGDQSPGGGISFGAFGLFSNPGNSFLTLTSSIVIGNSTTGDRSPGGGISFGAYSPTNPSYSSLTLTNSTVSGNSTTGIESEGGGIYASVPLILSGSTVSGNSTAGENSPGGGISGDSTDVMNSTVSGNSTAGTDSNGGGIFSTSGLTLVNSTVSSNTSVGESSLGGGIAAFDVTAIDSEIVANSTTGREAAGGGIASTNVSLSNSNISRNFTSGDVARGGGIYASSGTVTLAKTTVSNNSTFGLLSFGGGIATRRSLFELGTLTINDSAVIGNSTAGDIAFGGGIFSGFDTTSLTNSTVSGNSTTGRNVNGGGVVADGGVLTLTNSTVSGNVSTGEGGGLHTGFAAGSLDFVIENSIVAGNRQNVTPDTNGTPNDLVPGTDDVLTINHSLIGVADNITQTIEGSVDNQFGTAASPLDPLLAPLADNGGPTQTHALLPSSPAIDAGSNALATAEDGAPLLTDQRGDGFDRIVSGTVDLGAFEFDPTSMPSASAMMTIDLAFEARDLFDDELLEA